MRGRNASQGFRSPGPSELEVSDASGSSMGSSWLRIGLPRCCIGSRRLVHRFFLVSDLSVLVYACVYVCLKFAEMLFVLLDCHEACRCDRRIQSLSHMGCCGRHHHAGWNYTSLCYICHGLKLVLAKTRRPLQRHSRLQITPMQNIMRGSGNCTAIKHLA